MSIDTCSAMFYRPPVKSKEKAKTKSKSTEESHIEQRNFKKWFNLERQSAEK
jgi:hypothetical protein